MTVRMCSAFGRMFGSRTALLALFVAPATVSFAQQPSASSRASTPYIEAHTHIEGADAEAAIEAAVAGLARQNATRVFVQMPPDTFEHAGVYDAERVMAAAKKHPGTVAVLGGGGTLNAMIQKAVATGDTGPAVLKAFTERAEALAAMGVVGFGEMTAEHFDGGTPYQYAPADHPLFLALADLSARHRMPIDLHLEAVPEDMPLPSNLKSPPNAAQLHANIAAFERLLAHNRKATIIWAHGGSDATGFRTPDLCRRLLAAHANLIIELKLDPLKPGRNYPVDAAGTIKADWLRLLSDFPDRFIVGTDQHYPEPKEPLQRWQAVVAMLNQLPVSLQKAIGSENTLRVFPRVTTPQ